MTFRGAIMRRVSTLVAGLLAVTFLASGAAARCVRDIAPSGAISVRCSDGVRGYLPSDDAPPPSANNSYRSSSDGAKNPRSDNYAAPTTGSSGSYVYKSPETGGRANDSAASALNRSSDPTAGALSRGRSSGVNDRAPY